METMRRLCEEAERNFDPSRSMMENLVGVEFRHRAAVALWNFVKDMDEGASAYGSSADMGVRDDARWGPTSPG